MNFDVKGKRVFASTGGKPFDNSKTCVIFLCGSGLDHTFWGLHSRFFAFRNYSVLALDLPGHTHSEGPSLKSIEEIGEWLNDVVEAERARVCIPPSATDPQRVLYRQRPGHTSQSRID